MRPTEFDRVFSLNSRSNYSAQWVGLSSESDPYLLQHYSYDDRDIYPMFRLDFRKIVDEEAHSAALSDQRPWPENDKAYTEMPINFMMTHEEILQDTFSSQEKILSSGNTEANDVALLDKTVPFELGKRLLEMCVELSTLCVKSSFTDTV